jgi:hypothetical protein
MVAYLSGRGIMNIAVASIPRHFRVEMSRWLQEHRFTHFITLTTHNPSISIDGMNNRLKQWDARMNRALYGPKWSQHRDQLIWFFAFLESPQTNPHWHLLLRIDDSPASGKPIGAFRLEAKIRAIWSRLAPAGTVDVQPLGDRIDAKLVDYVGKQLGSVAQYSSFVTPDHFRRT